MKRQSPHIFFRRKLGKHRQLATVLRRAMVKGVGFGAAQHLHTHRPFPSDGSPDPRSEHLLLFELNLSCVLISAKVLTHDFEKSTGGYSEAETKRLDTHQKAVHISTMARKSDEEIVEMKIDVKRGTFKQLQKILNKYDETPDEILHDALIFFDASRSLNKKLDNLNINIQGNKVKMDR